MQAHRKWLCTHLESCLEASRKQEIMRKIATKEFDDMELTEGIYAIWWAANEFGLLTMYLESPAGVL